MTSIYLSTYQLTSRMSHLSAVNFVELRSGRHGLLDNLVVGVLQGLDRDHLADDDGVVAPRHLVLLHVAPRGDLEAEKSPVLLPLPRRRRSRRRLPRRQAVAARQVDVVVVDHDRVLVVVKHLGRVVRVDGEGPGAAADWGGVGRRHQLVVVGLSGRRGQGGAVVAGVGPRGGSLAGLRDEPPLRRLLCRCRCGDLAREREREAG